MVSRQDKRMAGAMPYSIHHVEYTFHAYDKKIRGW
jgi:hypothetical protein